MKAEIYTRRFWERPDPLDAGDENHERLFTAIGQATSGWEFLEIALSDLFMAFTKTTGVSYHAVLRTYGTIFGNAGRRSAVRSAAEVYFGEYWKSAAIQNSVTDLLNAVEWASKLRDDVVHGVVYSGVIINRPDGTSAQYGGFLVPPHYNSGRTFVERQTIEGDLATFSDARYRYTSKQIMVFVSKFVALTREIHAYRNSILQSRDGKMPLVESMIREGLISKKENS